MAGLGRSYMNMDLFTDAYRITGRIRLPPSGGLIAELNNPNTDYMNVEDSYISRIHKPGEIIANYSHSVFRKSNINFVVVQDRREALPIGSTHGHSGFLRGRPLKAFLTVPSFEIEGEIIHDGKPEPDAVLVQSAGRFQNVFSATASASIYPNISYTGDLILVHKDRVGLFCLDLLKQ